MAFTPAPPPVPLDSQVSSVRYGQKVDPVTGLTSSFTEQDQQAEIAKDSLGVANVEITPTDKNSSLVRTTVIDGPAILAFYRSWVETGVAIDLPQTLDSITTTYEINSGEGASSETADGTSIGSNPSLSISLNGSAQSSAAIIPDLQIIITPHALSNAVVTKVVFYAAQGDDETDILTRLTSIMGATVNAWPKFDQSLETHVFTLKGQQASIAAGVTAKQSVSIGDTDTSIISQGTSDSYQVGNSAKTIITPPTIHGAISITANADSTAIDATADIDIEAATNWEEIIVTKTASATVTATVTPTSVAATSPVSAIPSTGLYLYKLNGELSPYAGYSTQYAIIFSFAANA